MDEGGVGGGGAVTANPLPLPRHAHLSWSHTQSDLVNSRFLHGKCELWKHQYLSTPIRSACRLDFRAQYNSHPPALIQSLLSAGSKVPSRLVLESVWWMVVYYDTVAWGTLHNIMWEREGGNPGVSLPLHSSIC